MGGHYTRFLHEFVTCCAMRGFGKVCKTETLSSYLSVAMESFLLLVYINGYNEWRKTYGVPGDESSVTDDSTVSSDTTGSVRTGQKSGLRYTSEAKGAKKYRGWSNEGLCMYNKIVKKLQLQRRQNITGKLFEDNLLRVFMGTRDNEDEDDNGVDALNLLEEYMMENSVPV